MGCIGVGAAIVVVIIIVAVASGSKSNNGTAVNGSQSPGASAQRFSIGQQVKVGDSIVFTVNSFTALPAGQFEQPSPGNEFLDVNVTVQNVGTTSQTVSSALNFDLRDGTGQKYTETIYSGKTPPDGQVSVGSKLAGDLVYEVPATGSGWELHYSSDILASGEVIVTLGAPH